MIPSDPLFTTQWYLRNNGQSGGTAGKDIDVTTAWNYATGANIRILDIDTGIDFNNRDIAPNYDASTSQSVDAPNNSGYPFSTDGSTTAQLSHGTETAGLIAAASNGYGIVGVAFNARISSFRVLNTLAGRSDPFGTLALAFLASENFDVANNSWGFNVALSDSVFNSSTQVATTVLLEAATNGRGGLGTINVFAAGNAYQSGDNTNLHAFQSSINVVTVAALDANGTINAPGGRYSAPGSTILVSAPGTEVISSTILGSGNAGDGNQNSGLNGTSFAAPLVTGVIALMLQANPHLGIRDVQQILAYTARKTDPSSSGWHINHAVNWNGGGLEVSNDYGYGLVDATAAVALAQSWGFQHTIGSRVINTVGANTIGGILATGTSFRFDVTSANDLMLNWARVQVQMSFTTFGNLSLVLTSPTGTSSVLLNRPDDGLGGNSFDNTMQLSSVQFWGERAIGQWTLTVGDADTSRGDTGTMFSAILVLVGDVPSTDTTYVYTDQYAAEAVANPLRKILNDTDGGANILNTAAVSSAVTLSLAPGATSTIAGTSLMIGNNTIITTAIAGNGGATIVGNQFGDVLRAGGGDDHIQGGAGNDQIAAGAGTNVIDGGGGTNTAIYAFTRSAYNIANISGTVHVDGPDCSDSLTNIQFLSFADGTIQSPPSTTPIESKGATTLTRSGNNYVMLGSGGTGPTLQYQGAAVAVGQFGAVAPIGAEAITGGYEVAWKVTGANQYIVWNTDGNGNYTGNATAGVVPGTDFTLETLETSFQQDLNGDGKLRAAIQLGTNGGDTVNLVGQTQTTTINLGADAASVSAGLNAPSLAFIGTPDAIALGSGAATIQYALAASSGIETIANFVYGLDLLNIDMLGAAANALRAFDTTVGGAHAISIASAANLTHGVVLLNMPAGQTAADLLANHTTFSGGHALIG